MGHFDAEIRIIRQQIQKENKNRRTLRNRRSKEKIDVIIQEANKKDGQSNKKN